MFDKPQKDNEVIAYLNGKAIVRDDDGKLFYVVIPKEFVNIGDLVLEDDLKSFTLLSECEQKEILLKLEE